MSDNPDLREKIVENRGTWKKLQLKIPGLREYRKLEDIRAADQLLRKQVSDNLNESRSLLDNLRQAVTAKGDYTNLTTVGNAISKIQQVAGQIQHAQQGSAGISPNIRIDDGILNKLYEYDYNFVNSAEQVYQSCSNSVTDYNSGKSVQEITSAINTTLENLSHSWKQRLESVENILVTK
ncbi:MAG: hypothetical protein KGH76_06645 [Thaumarchaeota archaeon]|nr:hypothetical protein [Nitrososphaerota archaeon]